MPRRLIECRGPHLQKWRTKPCGEFVMQLTKGSIVWFDLETTGLDENKDQIIQIAAIATMGGPDFAFVDSFEVKVNPTDPELVRDLRKRFKQTNYTPEVWQKEAVAYSLGLSRFAAFLSKHASVRKVSNNSGRPYHVAKLAGTTSPSSMCRSSRPSIRRGESSCPLSGTGGWTLCNSFSGCRNSREPSRGRLTTSSEHSLRG